MIDLERLVAETFVRHADWHDRLASTNDLALQQAVDSTKPAPWLIGASSQSAGRGRGSNTWWAADGTLTFSVVFDMPELGLPQSEWPRFSLGTALSVAETIEAFLPHTPAGLKWPNDVWLGNRKVCGILIEQPDRAPGKLVVGIGLNVNTRFDAAPEELQLIATSLAKESGQQFAMADVLIHLLRRWQINIVAQRSGDWELPRLWSRLCVLSGRQIHVNTASTDITGVCQGIADDGALLIARRDDPSISHSGEILRCYAGTVRLLD